MSEVQMEERRGKGNGGDVYANVVGRFDRKKWDEHKSRIVEEGNYHKFTKGKESSEMRAKLLTTGERELVEVSVEFCREWRRVCADVHDRRLQQIVFGVWAMVQLMQRRIETSGVRTGWAKLS